MSQPYHHIQIEPQKVWVVNHNLHTRTPIVDAIVFDGQDLVKAQPQVVKMVDMNRLELHWSYPRTGRAGVV